MRLAPKEGTVTEPPSTSGGTAEIPTRPPQVRLPTSLPSPRCRKWYGSQSPPEPENWLTIMTFGPQMEARGVG